tara:strand:+ start:209 stop:529 length:321 start_codon:yes stop_codon:yes gene_type:complete
MIYLNVRYIENPSGTIEQVRSEYLVSKHQIAHAAEVMGDLCVVLTNGRILFCEGVLDSIIGQLENDDYKLELETLQDAIDEIGLLLGKALYKFQEYRSEDLTRPVC